MSNKTLLNLFIVLLILVAVWLQFGDRIGALGKMAKESRAEATPLQPQVKIPQMSTAHQGKTYYCTGEYVRPRSTPDFTDESNVLEGIRLMKGDTVTLLGKSVQKFEHKGKKGSWHQVRIPDGREAWVFYYLEERKPLPPPPHLPKANRGADPESILEQAADWIWKGYKGSFGEKEDKQLVALIRASDFSNPEVRNTAAREAVKNKAKGEFNLGQVCNLYEYAVKDWGYVNDPGFKEYVAKASESLNNRRNGDCDDFAVLVYSLVTAIGADARICYAYGRGGHAFTEVNIGDGDNIDQIKEYISIRFSCPIGDLTGFRRDSNGDFWMNMDWFDDPKHVAGQHFNWNRGVAFYVHTREFKTF